VLFKVLERMTPLEIRFFEKIDSELAKVQDFYQKRLKEALDRSTLIKGQLNELEDHRQAFNVWNCPIISSAYADPVMNDRRTKANTSAPLPHVSQSRL
jgi:SPX domain